MSKSDTDVRYNISNGQSMAYILILATIEIKKK
jgi:hypothetical protein